MKRGIYFQLCVITTTYFAIIITHCEFVMLRRIHSIAFGSSTSFISYVITFDILAIPSTLALYRFY